MRCGWVTYDIVWTMVLNRRQNLLRFSIISIANRFPPQVILDEERKDHWYNCNDVLYWYKHDNPVVVGSILKFLWSSEESGFRHLYKIVIQIADFDPEPIGPGMSSRKQQQVVKSKLIQSQQLTSGSWEVSDSSFWVDEENDYVYFMGNKDTPLEQHLYVVPVSANMSRPVSPRRLTKEDYSHSVSLFDPENKFFIGFQSNLTIPPFSHLSKLVMEQNAFHSINLKPQYMFMGLPDNFSLDEDSTSEEHKDKVQYLGPTPHLFEYKLKSGELIYGFFIKPDFIESGVKYPVVLEVYGGPEVQFVTKAFKGRT